MSDDPRYYGETHQIAEALTGNKPRVEPKRDACQPFFINNNVSIILGNIK